MQYLPFECIFGYSLTLKIKIMDEKVCCLEFDPTPWAGTQHEWTDKRFIRDTVTQFAHMPLPGQMGKVITRMWNAANTAGVAPKDPADFLLLAHDPSPWKSDLYLAVEGENPDLKNTVTLSGTFVTKAYDGPYRRMPEFFKDMERGLAADGKVAQKYYVYYAYCPKCAKKYEHNWMVIFAQLA